MSCPKLTVLTTLVWIAVIGVSGTNAQSIYLGGLNVIRRANLDGSNLETLLTASGGVQEIALDVAGGKMYWTVRGPDTRIQRANLDGSELEVLVSSGLSDLHGIALDVDAGKMYWTDMGSEKIQRADLDGSNVEDLITTGLETPYGLALTSMPARSTGPVFARSSERTWTEPMRRSSSYRNAGVVRSRSRWTVERAGCIGRTAPSPVTAFPRSDEPTSTAKTWR